MIQKLDLEQLLESIQGRIILKQKQLFIQTFLCIPWTIDMQQIIREMRQMTALIIKSLMNHPALQGELLKHSITKGFTAMQKGESALMIVDPIIRRFPKRVQTK